MENIQILGADDYKVHLPENWGEGYDDVAQVQCHFAKQFAKTR